MHYIKKFFTALLVPIALLTTNCLVAPSAYADVNDFHFSDFVGDYYLSRDNEGRSTLKIIETFTAEFPNYPQNKGIYRAIPIAYGKHSVSLQLGSILRNGEPENIYSKEYDNNNLVIATGTDDYLLGPQTYTFEYTLRDVTKTIHEYETNTTYQDFYWDTIGTDHYQDFKQVTANLHLDDSIKDNFNGNFTCYQGGWGSTETCTVEQVSPNLIVFQATRNMSYNENITMAVGFLADTFEPYQNSWLEELQPFIAPTCTALIILSFIWAAISYKKRTNIAEKIKITPVQYLPPKDISLTFASGVYNNSQKTVPAQIIDLAVKHHIEIIENKKSGVFKKSSYTLKLINTSNLLPEESKFISLLFPNRDIGAEYDIDKNNSSLGTKLNLYLGQNETRAIAAGYRAKVKSNFRPMLLFVLSLVLSLGFVIAANLTHLVIIDNEEWLTLIFFFHIISFVFLAILCAHHHPLSQKGEELKNYLNGLKTYINLAEKDRLKFLQSPEGATKTPVNTDDKKQLVHLYEKILPYAILFGIEKQWAKQLAIYYEDTHIAPAWYHGHSTFNAILFANSINSLSSKINTSFAPPGSSSSGGSGGGGFSGGGGGGGGFGGR